MDFKRTKNRIKILNVLNYTSTPLCAEDVYTMLNKEIKIGSNEIKHQYLSAKKARDILGWNPKYTIEDGLAKTVKWYKEFLGDK